ncbi:meiosis protein SPO22/ZIP4 like-domain-containing protein [Immersiella caudata]|uniref:Meiosis protein SPO22/ZIP4 like-domain-containing protein n=1 Tax=Immersiella caudata TaxID=314043 RepID=A0AA39X478_9PEZI|nr:meiosis protein SPO22/ZIP4 like-domain-containing protein [Immersiella caudata]
MSGARAFKHPALQAARKTESLIEAALNFARNLYQILSSDPRDAPATDSLIEEAKKNVENLHTSQPQTFKYIPGISGDPEIDKQATRLWNICTRLKRDFHGASPEEKRKTKRLRKLCLHGRVLALHLLGLTRARVLEKEGRIGDVVYLLRLALKAGRDCIEEKEPRLASSVLAKAADYKGLLQDGAGKMTKEEIAECNCFEVEYFIIRTGLSWIGNRLDLAEHMYTKAERLQEFLTPQYAERLADVLFEIGKAIGAGDPKELKDAIKWLGRANDVINGQNLEDVSREGVELRLAILQALITALLRTGTQDSLDRAEMYVDCIETEIGRKPIVSLLRLELLQRTPAEAFDCDAYGDILRRMIRDFNHGEAGFKLIIHHTRKLHDKSPAIGGAVLDDFIMTLTKSENDGWMEKAVVTRMWMITNQRDTIDTIHATRGVLGYLSRPLSEEAAVAAQALIWKKVEANYTGGHLDLAEAWCSLALHTVFQNCGPNNTSKLERKLLLCALSRNKIEAALLIVQGMSPNSWKEPMTAYLAFKVAIRVDDRVLAERCIEAIGTMPDHVDYLGACIAECQQFGEVYCTITALRKLQDNYEYKDLNPVHLPALFRCTIRLLNKLVETPDSDKNQFISELCDVFDAVVLALEKQKRDSTIKKLFTVDEIEWFGRNAYDVALKHTTEWDLRNVVRILNSSVTILGHFPSDAGSQAELSLRSLFARFIISSALISLARVQDNIEKQQQDYLAMRTHVRAFDGELVEHLTSLDGQDKGDLARKQAILLTFDFEAAVALGQWDDLGPIVQRAVACGNTTAYQAMADSLLRGRVSGQVLYSTMRKIINEIWALDSFDATKLAKYTRCLFQATLPLDDSLAMRLLDEACSKARELREGDASWPEEEVEWMASTAFNHGIDCFGSQETERAKEWVTKAINLSRYCNDEGGLERALQERYLRLNFDARSI